MSVIDDEAKQGLHVLVLEYVSVLMRTVLKIEPRVNFHRRYLWVYISYLSSSIYSMIYSMSM